MSSIPERELVGLVCVALMCASFFLFGVVFLSVVVWKGPPRA